MLYNDVTSKMCFYLGVRADIRTIGADTYLTSFRLLSEDKSRRISELQRLSQPFKVHFRMLGCWIIPKAQPYLLSAFRAVSDNTQGIRLSERGED